MLKRLTSLITICCGLALSGAKAADLTITTGGASGTYFRFGNDIAQVAENIGLSVDVIESRGSVQNLSRLLGYEGSTEGQFYQLAIVQADVLAELREQAAGNQILSEIVSKVKVVMPLYGEEVHVFARNNAGYRDFDDLLRNGFVLAGGREGSGTLHTANTLVQRLSRRDVPILVDASGGEIALNALLEDQISSMIDVAGAPSRLGESIELDDNLRLLDLRAPALLDVPDSPYRPVRVTPEDYPWLDGSIETIAVTSLLVAYDYDEENINCDNIRRLTEVLIDGLGRLQSDGHPKWRDVDPAFARERTDLYSCARQVIYDE